MIKLKVEPYCQECSRFEALSKTEVMHAWNPVAMYDTSFVETTITCEHAADCKRMYDYLTKQHTKELMNK